VDESVAEVVAQTSDALIVVSDFVGDTLVASGHSPEKIHVVLKRH